MLWQLLRFFNSCLSNGALSDQANRSIAQDLIYSDILPLLPQLLRSFDPATVNAATGNNALHEICAFFVLATSTSWSSRLAQAFITRGVSVHARNKRSRTPLLVYAATSGKDMRSANGLRLLLTHGADLNAQDDDGDGLLHHLARGQALGVLEDMCTGGGAGLDYALLNSAGQTAADLAAIKLVETDSDTDESLVRARRIHRLLLAQTALWTTHSRPVLLRCLDGMLPVTDVAKLVLAYVDGSGPPFSAAVEDSDDDWSLS